MEMATTIGAAGFKKVGVPLKRPTTCVQACDKDPACRNVLMSHPEPPLHVLGKIEDRLTPYGAKLVKQAEQLNRIDKESSFLEKNLDKLPQNELEAQKSELLQVGLRCIDRLMSVS
jgi:hypothetical protein